ncbi:delta 9-fatty acid desaturase protein [Amylostereum chailletii]|nr:delta 9-fatty acid desaturase protein [Amylostereum chailletii]
MDCVRRVRWFNLSVEAALPLLSLYGGVTTTLSWSTLAFCVSLYVLNMLGVTAGYHRLWSHRSYNAHPALQLFLCLAGTGAIQGSVQWWSRGHRAHHRYTDTDRDPYGAHLGLWHTHLGWMLFKPTTKPGAADVSDLKRNPIVAWQHRYYFLLALLVGLVLPTCVPGYFWGDWRGGLFFAGFTRLFLVHHVRVFSSVFCVNSVAHWLGETTYDDKLSPRDHVLTALLTLGEGYHNFHHQFPADYRNAVRWYQYDPTKWFIALCAFFGLASHLKTFPDGEIRKGRLTMRLKSLKREQDALTKPPDVRLLPVLDWKTFQEQASTRPLVLIAGLIHDVTDFIDGHPGGPALVSTKVGKDATADFFGGVYNHSNAAHNLLSGLRVGVLHGGLEHVNEADTVPPWQTRNSRSQIHILNLEYSFASVP